MTKEVNDLPICLNHSPTLIKRVCVFCISTLACNLRTWSTCRNAMQEWHAGLIASYKIVISYHQNSPFCQITMASCTVKLQRRREISHVQSLVVQSLGWYSSGLLPLNLRMAEKRKADEEMGDADEGRGKPIVKKDWLQCPVCKGWFDKPHKCWWQCWQCMNVYPERVRVCVVCIHQPPDQWSWGVFFCMCVACGRI